MNVQKYHGFSCDIIKRFRIPVLFHAIIVKTGKVCKDLFIQLIAVEKYV